MKKILISMLLSAAITLPTLAVGPMPKVWTVKQSDSTSIKIMVIIQRSMGKSCQKALTIVFIMPLYAMENYNHLL